MDGRDTEARLCGGKRQLVRCKGTPKCVSSEQEQHSDWRLALHRSRCHGAACAAQAMTAAGPSAAGPGWMTLTSGSRDYLDDVACPSTSTCFAVGHDGVILATSNGGKTWTRRRPAPQLAVRYQLPDCHQMRFPGSRRDVPRHYRRGQNVDATGLRYGEHAGGHQLSQCHHMRRRGRQGHHPGHHRRRPELDSAASVISYPLPGVSCPNATTCFAVSQSGAILASTDEGSKSPTWTLQTSGTLHFLSGISCPSSATCFAVGDQGTILATTNGGRAWKTYVNEVRGESPMGPCVTTSISCPSATTCTAVTEKGTAWPLPTAVRHGPRRPPPLRTSGSSAYVSLLRHVDCPSSTFASPWETWVPSCDGGNSRVDRGGHLVLVTARRSSWRRIPVTRVPLRRFTLGCIVNGRIR